MCLLVDEKKTAERLSSPEEIVTRYKVVEIGNGKVNSIVYDHNWIIGCNKAVGIIEIKSNWNNVKSVAASIHVFITKEDASKACVIYGEAGTRTGLAKIWTMLTVMEVKCHKSDLVAAGSVFLGIGSPVQTEAYKQVYVEKLPEVSA